MEFDISGLSRMTTEEMRAIGDKIMARMSELLYTDSGENRTLEGDDSAEYNRLHNQLTKVIDAQRIAETFRDHGGVTPFAGRVGGRVPSQRAVKGLDVHPDDIARMGPQELRDKALRALDGAGLEGRNASNVDAAVRSKLSADQPYCDGSYVARRILVTESEHYRSAFHQVMTSPHPLLNNDEIIALRAYRDLENGNRAAGEITPGAGGYGVPVFIDPTILLSSGAAAAPLLDISRIVPVTTNVWKGITSGPITFAFQTEAAAATDDSPTLVQPSITVHTARGFIPYSIEVGQDYAGFAAEMSSLLTNGWTDIVAQKTVVGSGTGEPFGIYTRLDATAGSEIKATTAGTFDGAQVFRTWNALPERYRSRATWLYSVSTESAIRAFGASPVPSSYFTVDLTAGGITNLNGRPSVITDYCPTYTGTTGTENILVVGDFSNYVIAMRQGLQVEPISHLFQQVTAGSGPAVPTGQRGFFAWGRMGADAAVPGAFRILNQT